MCISDIINTAIGAFLGFVFGFLLEMIIENQKRQNSIENIKIELNDILITLEKTKDDFTVLNNFYVPVWNAVLYTGDILSYIKKPYYKQLIMIYSKIIYLNNLESKVDEKDNNFNENMSLIIKTRRDLYDRIKELKINSLK